jgi:hypothetical protein
MHIFWLAQWKLQIKKGVSEQKKQMKMTSTTLFPVSFLLTKFFFSVFRYYFSHLGAKKREFSFSDLLLLLPMKEALA